MKGILMNTTTLAGKTYKYDDITKGIVNCSFPQDKFYGGRVTRFGKTKDGLLLCLEKNQEEVIDIFVDLDNLNDCSVKILKEIAAKVKKSVLISTPGNKRDAMEEELAIPEDAKKDELIAYIKKYARAISSD